jgi:hypothetical protein
MSTESLQLKNPIVLVHGLGARSTYGPIEYFYGLNKLLKDAKNKLKKFFPKDKLISLVIAWGASTHAF